MTQLSLSSAKRVSDNTWGLRDDRLLPLRRVLTASAVAFAGALSSPVGAATLEFDFDAPIDPEDAVVFELPSGEFSTPHVSGGVLTLSDDLSPDQGGAVSIGFLPFGVDASDVIVDVVANATGGTQDRVLLLARLDLETGAAYSAGVDFSTMELVLSRTEANGVETLATSLSAGLSNDEAYQLRFSVFDNLLALQVFSLSGELLDSIAVTDDDNAPLGAGGVGIAIDQSGAPGSGAFVLNATFDDLAVTAVPLPASGWLFAAGLGFLMRTRAIKRVRRLA
ncbi:MAG: hypothetical protein AAGA68_21120 [Pseudomonadota bacterium]